MYYRYWGQVSTAYAAETVESADAYLLAGAVFNDYTTTGWTLLMKDTKVTPCSSCMAADCRTSQMQLPLCVRDNPATLQTPSSIISELQCVAFGQMVHVASNSVKIGGAQIFSCIVMSEFLTALAGLRTSKQVAVRQTVPYVRMAKSASSHAPTEHLTACPPGNLLP
jgi:TPP-dependent 2-oxoacid decarboxylase